MTAKHSGVSTSPVSSDLRNALAKNLREARLAAGLTQKALGDLTGISREYIGQVENATANVSIEVLSILALHVGKPPLSLLAPPKRPPPVAPKRS
jgi:transcriptional regulator with XRE-family HTH domain